MYGEWVTLNLGEGIECKVYVTCTPNTNPIELEDRALNILRNKANETKSWAG